MVDAATFDVLDFVQGRSYPKDTVNVYTDAGAVYEIAKLETEISNELDSDVVDRLDGMVRELKAQVRATSLTFHLRGLPSPIITDVNNQTDAKHGVGADTPEKANHRLMTLLALSIVEVEKPDGTKDSRDWDFEAVEKLTNGLPTYSANKLLETMVELTLKSRSFEDFEVTPDFS